MKHFRYILFLTFALMLTACGEGEETASEPNDSDETKEETDSEEASTESEGTTQEDEEDNATNEDDTNEENTEGVAPSDPDDTIDTVDFQRVTWIGYGYPDRQPEAGVWLYTEDNQPDDDDKEFDDLDQQDVLLYQTDDYMGHELRAQQIVLEDDDTARVIVDIHREPHESDDEEDYEMPRQYLSVEKDELRDKEIIVETEDGDTLNVQ
ncbi:hypothetical protein HUG20_16735 [Salicibibacter cibi]|uniref:Uncharacterized protein n=1 Tax=Salicibibacter cibi TaxID=2743001 RepID=A0A7T6ZD90_9BACI|nr:hypothetical protein [Salicibibacter cibi]QQK81391.1 hypothetical protein HUG20_16735 [Salicibibacter cibi]